MIKAVIFDIGGVLSYDVWENVLLDPCTWIAVEYNLDRERVFKLAHDLLPLYLFRSSQSDGDWIDHEKEYWEHFIAEFKLKLTTDYFIEKSERYYRAINGMGELIQSLKTRGIGLGICSNNTEFWFRRQFSKLDLFSHFAAESVILSCRIGVAKTSPGFEMFRAATNSLNLDKSECIFIDDRVDNVEYSLRFGMPSILFPSHSEYGQQYLSAILSKMGLI